MINLEPILKSTLDSYMDDVYTSIPAVIVGIQQLKDGLVDVQPLVSSVFGDGSTLEQPEVYSVPIIMPCTATSSILMPVNHGDTVWLMFSQRDIDVFKNGSDTPHTASSFRKFNMNDAVALIGIKPVPKSSHNPQNHNVPISPDSLTITHNVGTERESIIDLSIDGSVSITSVADINLKAEVINMEATSINMQTDTLNINANSVGITSSNVDIKSTVLIDGMNLNNFMLAHNHPYTDDGRPMTTAQPQGF